MEPQTPRKDPTEVSAIPGADLMAPLGRPAAVAAYPLVGAVRVGIASADRSAFASFELTPAQARTLAAHLTEAADAVARERNPHG